MSGGDGRGGLGGLGGMAFDDVARGLDEAQERVRSLGGLLGAAGAERFTGASADGLVTAEVTGAGALLGVHVSARAMRDLDHVGVGRAAAQAIGEARSAASARLMDTIAELTGQRPPGPEEAAKALADTGDTAERFRGLM
ncbi:MAG: YbaB/EbfC family nucleoid-associated protein [Catenulispora sp.]|nr:YbaB/EbfC family nucleoid-associated protein [Catenulispora sp.]